jgi:hypothetical protein
MTVPWYGFEGSMVEGQDVRGHWDIGVIRLSSIIRLLLGGSLGSIAWLFHFERLSTEISSIVHD